jgi:hypothetical protein
VNFSANLDDSLSGLEAGFNFRPHALKSGEQRLGAAIAEPNPEQLDLRPGWLAR